MLSKLKRIIKYPRRRGYSILFFSLLFIVVGQSLYLTPMTDVSKESLWAHLQIFPPKYWGIVWMSIGILNAIGGWLKHLEGLAFAASAAVMAIWAAGYAINELLGHGYRSYIGFVIYASFSAFILLISGWPEE